MKISMSERDIAQEYFSNSSREKEFFFILVLPLLVCAFMTLYFSICSNFLQFKTETNIWP